MGGRSPSRRCAGSSPDSPERPTKRRRVEGSMAQGAAMDFCAMPFEDPGLQASPVPSDSWTGSTLPPNDTNAAALGLTQDFDLEDHSSGLQASIADGFPPVGSSPNTINAQSRSSRSQSLALQYEPRTSPFYDCRGIISPYPSVKFTLPAGGQVNGYIKLQGTIRGSSTDSTRPVRRTSLTPDESQPAMKTVALRQSRVNIATSNHSESPGSVVSQLNTQTNDSFSQTFETEHFGSPVPSINSEMLAGSSPSVAPAFRFPNARANFFLGQALRQLSPFAHLVNADDMGSRLWSFYLRNFIPGRTILASSNIWNDFAAQCDLSSVRSVIMSYMGFYIYDFTHSGSLARRINLEYVTSEKRCSELLGSTRRSVVEDSELVTLLIIFAMQDVVLPERRRKLPHLPRWLLAYIRAEEVLDARDPGSRFWHKNNIQLTRLQIAHHVMVGRGLILSEPLSKLSANDLERRSERFQWLLYGDTDEIHGACGFSRKLLYRISQITWVTACQAANPDGEEDWTRVASFIFEELHEMRQINPEGAQPHVSIGSQPIEDIRMKHQTYIITTKEEMTEVTAEAWRIAIITYFQCRFWRLPRNHPNVVSNLDDLAHCVRILPTSGHIFTAQSPLFPVFLLGLLGTTDLHRLVCHHWMLNVQENPGRSSVPPLHAALRKLWHWMSEDPRITPLAPEDVPASFSARDPWWEHLVQKVLENENEILCLT